MGRAARPLEQAAILAPSYGREQCSSQLPGVSSLCSLLRSTPRLFSVSLFFVSWAYVRVYVGACECACVRGSRRRPEVNLEWCSISFWRQGFSLAWNTSSWLGTLTSKLQASAGLWLLSTWIPGPLGVPEDGTWVFVFTKQALCQPSCPLTPNVFFKINFFTTSPQKQLSGPCWLPAHTMWSRDKSCPCPPKPAQTAAPGAS